MTSKSNDEYNRGAMESKDKNKDDPMCVMPSKING